MNFMINYNYTPIDIEKLDKKTKTFFKNIDLMIKNAPGIKKICVDETRFNLILKSMTKECQEFYKQGIPYKGIMIYCVYLPTPNYIDDEK